MSTECALDNNLLRNMGASDNKQNRVQYENALTAVCRGESTVGGRNRFDAFDSVFSPTT